MSSLCLLRLPNHTINRLRHILHIMRIQPGHTNPPILRHIHMRILPNLQHLFLRQPGKAKHANLIRDVVPRPRRLQLLQLPSQLRPHLNDPSRHRPQIRLPLAEQRRVVQHETGNARAVRGRIADLRPLQDRQLTANALDRVCSVRSRARDEVEAARTLAVKPKVLGKALRDAQLEALLDEMAHCPVILREVAGGEALVGAVEEGEVRLCFYRLGDLCPLLFCGVDAGGVVRAGVQEDDAAGGGGVEGGEHAGEVEGFGGRGEVGIGLDGEVDVGEDLVVVCPCWVGDVDVCVGML